MHPILIQTSLVVMINQNQLINFSNQEVTYPISVQEINQKKYC